MTTMWPTDPAPFGESAFPVMRCRRYLFDRADFPDDPRAPLGDGAASGRSAGSPPALGPEGGMERRR